MQRVLEIITDAITEVAGAKQRDLLGIGLGVPGPVDAVRGVSMRYSFLRDWHDVPIGQRRDAVDCFLRGRAVCIR